MPSASGDSKKRDVVRMVEKLREKSGTTRHVRQFNFGRKAILAIGVQV